MWKKAGHDHNASSEVPNQEETFRKEHRKKQRQEKRHCDKDRLQQNERAGQENFAEETGDRGESICFTQ